MQVPLIANDAGWQRIRADGINKLLNLLNTGFSKETRPFTHKEYMTVYDVCYRMCTQRTPHNWSEQLYERHVETFRDYLSDKVLPALQGKQDLQVLRELEFRWANHIIMNRWMFKFFAYLDRYYVDHHNLPKLMDSGLEQFKVEVFDHVKGAVTRAVLAQINNEREGEAIDRDHLKKCIFVYEKMGEGNLEVYQADFEAALLDGTREYYERKAAAWIATDNVPTYLVKVEKVLESEANRVQSFMNDTT
jgi:cullin 1